MKNSSITLDRVLHHILTEEEVGRFTIMELRDRYMKLVDRCNVSEPDLRMYLYDEIRKMMNKGWVAYDAERKSRGQRFFILDMPEGLKLKLIEPRKGMQPRGVECDTKQNETDSCSLTEQVPELQPKEYSAAEALTQMLKETRLDLLTSYGETERFAQMIQDIPGLKTTLEPELIASRDNSSRLLGHVNALETALQKIGEM